MREVKVEYKNLKVSAEIHHRLKVLSAQTGLTLTATIAQLLDKKILWESI